MKKISALFWTAVAGIALSFAMAVYTAVAQHRAESNAPRTIPTPAMLPPTGQ